MRLPVIFEADNVVLCQTAHTWLYVRFPKYNKKTPTLRYPTVLSHLRPLGNWHAHIWNSRPTPTRIPTHPWMYAKGTARREVSRRTHMMGALF